MGDRPRPSFRRRLVLMLGTGLTVALLAVGVLVWVGAYATFNYMARQALSVEAEQVIRAIHPADGLLEPEAYLWEEPHHRFNDPHIDPYYLQVFDAQGQLLRASDNLLTFGPYPDTLITHRHTTDLWRPLHYLNLSGRTLYMQVSPILTSRGTADGYIQLGRLEPGYQHLLRQLALGLAVGLVLVLLGLCILLHYLTGQALRPLAQITAATANLSAALDQRIAVPPAADRETALLAQTQNQLLDRLQRAFEEMKRFTANAAHTLQTPLTILHGHVDVTLRRRRAPEDYQRTLHLLRAELGQLIRMTRTLLLLARLDNRDEHLPQSQVDLSQVLKAEQARQAPHADEKGLTLTVSIEGSCLIHGHPDLLREMVANLLNNAIKYTPTGTIQATLTAHAAELTLRIQDQGMGIPPEAVAYVTDRFYRTAGATQQGEGHGLGLSIVAQVVALHQGSLHIDAAPGQGTTVSVTLPRQPT